MRIMDAGAIPAASTFSVQASTGDGRRQDTSKDSEGEGLASSTDSRCLRQETATAGDLGFEPSYPALGTRRNYVANALFCLRMRKNHTATTLNQHWGRTGNIFPYFSPVALARDYLPATGF